jgi:hypothetical protein
MILLLPLLRPPQGDQTWNPSLRNVMLIPCAKSYAAFLIKVSIIYLEEKKSPWSIGVDWGFFLPTPGNNPDCSLITRFSCHNQEDNNNSVALVLERTIPTGRPPLVSEVIANCCG